MSRPRNLLPGLLALLVLAAFAAGLWKLFALRFESGDVYADYSTLNTSPRGARALYESLERLGAPAVERNFLPLLRLKPLADTTLVFPGATRAFFGKDSEENFAAFEKRIASGLHVVAALNPAAVPKMARGGATANPWGMLPDFQPRPAPPAKEEKDGEDKKDAKETSLAAGERWGFSFEREVGATGEPPADGYAVSLPDDPAPGGRPALVSAETEFPRWFSPWRWAHLGDGWQVLAHVSGSPVIIRRPFGEGSLTLLTDSTFLSNEALWRAPRPTFLLRLLGNSPRVVFDETLLGTQNDPGVMALVRRYRLWGFFVGAAVLLALYAWRAATALVPPHPSLESVQDRAIAGAGGADGFVTLLRHSIPAKQVLRACFTEWARSPFVRRRYSEEAVAAARDAVVAGEADPAAGYRAAAGVLATSRKL